jgi:hypothetical protein
MYDNEIKDQFVELRAEGKSFGDISTQLGIAKSTLHRWEDEREADIARLRRIQWLETEAQCGRRIEDHLTHLIYHMMDCEDRIQQFKTTEYSLRDAFAILRQSRREYYQLRALLMGTGTTSRKSNKTERFVENAETNTRNTNDLQQPKPQSFDFPPAQNSTDAAVASHDSDTANEGSQAIPSPGGEGKGEGDSSVCVINFPESNKTERSQENATTEPHNTNDLKQSTPASFDSPSTQDSIHTAAAADDFRTVRERSQAVPSPGAADEVSVKNGFNLGQGEGDSNDSAPTNSAVENPSNSQPSPPDDFLGSIVINPLECGAAVVSKWLEHEQAHAARRNGKSH